MNVYRNVEVLPVKCCVFLLFSRPFVFLCVFCVCVVGRGLQFPSLIISPPTPHQPVNLSCIKPWLNLPEPARSFSLPSGNSAAAYPVFFYELCSSEIFNCGKGKTPSATLILSPALFVSTSTLRDSCHLFCFIIPGQCPKIMTQDIYVFKIESHQIHGKECIQQ